jgi:uncharacterized BrkB/YihY/UPF0761 family membrane protein
VGNSSYPPADPEASGLSSAASEAQPKGWLGRLGGWFLDLPPIRRPRAIMALYGQAGGSLMSEGLAYSALFAGATGLLFCMGILGYLVPSEADRARILGSFTGPLEPLHAAAQGGLANLASNAGAFSLVGLASLAWGASHFYGALDEAMARVFSCAPARGPIDRLIRGFVSVLLLVGGLISGIALAAIQRIATSSIQVGETDQARRVGELGYPLLTAVVVIVVVGVVYRVVPNTRVPIGVLWLPTLVAGLILTLLAELLVTLEPILAGSLLVFGGVAAAFAALAWLHLAFQVLMIGAAWTRLRLDDATATR